MNPKNSPSGCTSARSAAGFTGNNDNVDCNDCAARSPDNPLAQGNRGTLESYSRYNPINR
jgi:hypothetical protein